jgi:hypothetical protein
MKIKGLNIMPTIEIKNIERIEKIEKNFGINISGLYAIYEENIQDDFSLRYVLATGEITPLKGDKIKTDMHIVLTVYNAQEKVIGVGTNYIDAEEFFCVSPLELHTSVSDMPTKVKIYPKKV